MFGKKDIVYNDEHMTSIADKYKECEDVFTDAITHQGLLKMNLGNYYKGQASSIVEDVCDKIEEHLQLLVACCETTETYVRDALSTMEEADSENAKSIGGDK